MTPGAGRARIYVWRPSQLFGDSSLTPITVDGRLVGAPSPGTFLALDVDPGLHRVSTETGDGESAIVTLLQADSTYVFRALSRDGFSITEQALVQLTFAEGAAAVRGSRSGS